MSDWKETLRQAESFEERLRIGKEIMREFASGARDAEYVVRYETVEVFDREEVHIALDTLLLAIIGDDGIAQDFDSIDKWYA